MITFKTLRWSNMFSYGEDNFVDFTKYRLTQLVGKNGHGKTSVLHILEEILCNKNSKGYKKASILNRNVKANWFSGEVTFDKDSVSYSVSTKRTGATQKVVLLCDGKDISQHTATATYDLIESILGIEFKSLSQLIGQNSKSSLQFLTSTDTNRKKFLIDLLDYAFYTEEYEKAKAAHKKHSDELKILEVEYKHLSEWIKEKSSISLEKMSIVDVPNRPIELENNIKELREQIAVIDLTIKNIRKNNQYIELRNSISIDVLTEATEFIDTSKWLADIAVHNSEFRTAEGKISKISCLNDKCPTCLQNIDKAFTKALLDGYLSDKANSNYAISKLKELVSAADIKNARYKVVKKLIEDFEKYSSLIDNTIPTEEPNKKYLENKLESSKIELFDIQNTINAAKVHNDKAIAHNAGIFVIASQKDEMVKKLSEVKAKLDVKIELVNELEIIKKGFSTNGLVAYKIENNVKDLEELTNKYLEELSDGRFQLFFIITNDKLNVVIKDDGIDVEIEALSTGELSRVTTATLLAIRKLMATLSKSQINLLFLDETLDVLDDEGKEKLVDILVNEDNLNTFLISHGYRHPLLQTVSVVKKNKISKLYAN